MDVNIIEGHHDSSQEQEWHQIQDNSRHMQELLAEAQLEAGHESLETMDFGDEVIDKSRDQFAEDKPVGCPLLSEFFKTYSQEQEPCVCRRIDVQTRTQRHQHANAMWKEQMPILVNGYLAWRHGVPTIDDNTMVSNIFHVDVVGISGEVSFPQYITYFQQLRDQFSDAFDIYLQILEEIWSRVDWILGKDPNTWQINGACPSCTFKQPDESILSPAWLHVMDSNFSAKH
ncbi:hypothetical protein BDR04DRAFT_1118812 [Suillus decipiens]|nr:hypothetical protein BDR04DRAFT_1118812 [Suillus decipiens]